MIPPPFAPPIKKAPMTTQARPAETAGGVVPPAVTKISFEEG